MASEQLEVERRVDVHAQSSAIRQLRHGHPGHGLEPARQHVVRRQVRHGGENRRVPDGNHIGRVAVVRERPSLAGMRELDECGEVRARREGNRARPEQDEAGTDRDVGGHPAKSLPERAPVGRLGDDRDVVRAASREALREVRGDDRASLPDQARQLAGIIGRRRVQDSNRNGPHAATVAGCEATLIEGYVNRRVRAYIGLGANLGDARATLNDAVAALADLPAARIRGVSRLYRTKPVGVTDQPDFMNAVVALDVPAGPDPATGATNLLLALKGLEREFGRRKRRRWGPRELDLDLLLFGRHRLAIERPPSGAPLSVAIDPGAAARLLEVPHPSMGDRLFVLAPLADLAPRLVPPGWRETVETARRRQLTISGASAAVAIATLAMPERR